MAQVAMLPGFFPPSHVPDRGTGGGAPVATPDWRTGRLARGAYLLIVGIERFVRAAAALVLRIGSYTARPLEVPADGSSAERQPTEAVTPKPTAASHEVCAVMKYE